MIELIILGDPKPQKRHRTAMVGRNKNIQIQYDPSKQDKTDFWMQCLSQVPTTLLDGPLSIEISFQFSRPKNHFGTGKNSGILKTPSPIFNSHKPDIDNLQKFVLDALKGRYYKDDSQIVVLHSSKIYTLDKPKIMIKIKDYVLS